MLERLVVDQLALIEHAEVDFGAGLTVLTGETGAGKTALLCACKLLVGERADSSWVRDGAKACRVEGTFKLEGATHVAVREFGGARGRCWIDGQAVPASKLGEMFGPCVELHGQHEHQSLLKRPVHLALLDRFIDETCGCEGTPSPCNRACGTSLPLLGAAARARSRYEEALEARDAAKSELDALQEAARASQADIDACALALSQIDAVGPSLEEYGELEKLLPILQNASCLAEGAQEAYTAISGEGGAADLLAQACASLRKNQGVDLRSEELLSRMEDCSAELADISSCLRAWRDSLEFDPGALDAAFERMSQYKALIRSFGPGVEGVLEARERAMRLARAQDSSQESIQAASERLRLCEEGLDEAAGALVALREEHADAFSRRLSEQIQGLGMEQASIFAVLTDSPRDAWGKTGPDTCELYYAPSPATSPRPLRRIASGGELSRVLLACSAELAGQNPDLTLVYDEIDSGLGGHAGALVAERLACLSRSCQVIAVSHLASIAAKANCHLSVRKSQEASPVTTIERLEGDSRVLEVARMLSGQSGQAALKHAMSLLEGQE